MDIAPILAPVRAVARRVRVARALRAGATTLAPGVAGIAVALAARQLGWLDPADFALACAAGLGVPAVLTLASAARALPGLLPATLLDRAHALHGRLSAAIELQGSAEPLAVLAVEDALAVTKDVSPARAFPLAIPAHARALALALAAVGGAATLHRPPPPPAAPPPPPHLAALLVHPDDLALETDALHEIEARTDPTPELRAAIDDTNALLEALEDRSIDRTDALRQLSELTARLDRPRPASLVAREELLRAMGDRMGHGDSTADLAQALRDADADAAQQAMAALAERLRSETMSAAERRRLEEALAEARAAERTEEGEDLLHDAEEQLAEQEREERTTEEQERLLEQQREEVERLRQEHQERMEAEEELERLERELDDASEQLEREDGQDDAADSLDEAAEDLNRTAREQGSEEQMQQLAQQLRQLREMIRRQREQRGGQGEDGEGGTGDGQGSRGDSAGRMDRYVLRAGGGDDGTGGGIRLGVHSGGGSEGDGETEGSQGEGGEDQEGTPGGTSGSAQGEDGEGGSGGEEGEQQMLVLGDEGGGDAILELPGFGRSGRGEARGGSEGDGDESGGAGHDHDPTQLDDPTERSGDHRTVTVHGEDRGRGPSRSEVIRGGAARGFASRDYERVYADYEAHAERAIEEDEIPPGYRFYVRRYFDLIRPRD